MNDGLLGAVLERLDKSPLGDQEEALLLAALDGSVVLADALRGEPHSRRDPHVGSANGGRPPTRAYLRSVTVAGFRGIGPAATLNLEPGPGLSVVCGRNGSGKSSFAEALEVLLTGTTRRWQDRSAVWREGWRCLHATGTAIAAEMVIEGAAGPAKVSRTWETDAKRIEDSVAHVQLPGESQDNIDRLGWGDALSSYRPFLSHAELETLLAEPKDLYDQISRLLGLEDLEAAAKRLGEARRQAEREVKAPRERLPELRAELDASGDERAERALGLLGQRSPDMDRLEALAAGVSASDGNGTLAVLESLRGLNAPAGEAVQAAVQALREAASELERVGSSAAGEAETTARLLEAALDHFAGHGAGDCPVCGQVGVLNEQWQAATETRVTELRARAAALRQARQAAEDATRQARLLVGAAPDVLARASAPGVDGSAAAAAWATWADCPPVGAHPADLRRLGDHLERHHPPLASVVTTLAAAANGELARRQDRWAPVAADLASWCALARQGTAAKQTVDQIERAETWLKEASDRIRNDQLRPFADRTVQLWAELRQESNVELLRMRLAGAATRSHVDFDVTVDGQPASGLGVMSQGEVNALALSVFLPRATSVDSPLRFVVIDDPVQAMDPAKVEGLARVLAEVAETRQVVVFTHDDRLPEAVRRLDLPARILQVLRRADSVVEVYPAGDPCEQLLRDAGALARGESVPEAVAARVVPGICRTALETLCIELARRRRLRRGDPHDEVEKAIAEPVKLLPRVALAVFDDSGRAGEVYGWLNKRIGPWAADTVRACNEGSHGGSGGAIGALVADTRRLVDRLREIVG